MADVELKVEDIEAGYAKLVATLSRELAKSNVERAALARYIDEQSEALEPIAAEEEPGA